MPAATHLALLLAAPTHPPTPCRHLQVLPTQPCRGVEDWYRPNCGGVTEPIWTFAFKEMLNDVNKPRDKYGLAINPTSRRGQHQVRRSHRHTHTPTPPDSRPIGLGSNPAPNARS